VERRHLRHRRGKSAAVVARDRLSQGRSDEPHAEGCGATRNDAFPTMPPMVVGVVSFIRAHASSPRDDPHGGGDGELRAGGVAHPMGAFGEDGVAVRSPRWRYRVLLRWLLPSAVD
jgi:hypothetical protein